MNGKAVAYAIGKMMQLMSVVLCVPLGIAIYDLEEYGLDHILSHPETVGFGLAILICIVFGTIVSYIFRADRQNQAIREGYAIVAFGWIIFALIGSIPFFMYLLAQNSCRDATVILLCFTDGFFEIMSGFTTTGATILTDVEVIPDSLLFWRSLTHWLGGMGIITLAIAIFPAMGVSGYRMFRGEVPGPSPDRLRPRLAQTAAVLWGVYVLLSALETLLFLLGGMPLFDALCHTFGTMATGGFSTKNGSIGSYGSVYFEWVVIIFMYLAGMNFLLHFNIMRGRWKTALVDREFIFYTGLLAVVAVFFTIMLYGGNLKPTHEAYLHFRADKVSPIEFDRHVNEQSAKFTDFHDCLRHSLFQTVAITTTTGYGTADFDLWPNVARILLLILMFFGGCAGSTGGGMKQIRILVLIKTGFRELRRLTRPKLIAPLRVGTMTIEEDKIINIASFSILFILLFVVGSFLMALFVPDLVTAFASTAACINNIGPGLSGVGSIEHYGWIPIPGKWILVVCMLLGRLEIFTILIVFRPSFWK